MKHILCCNSKLIYFPNPIQFCNSTPGNMNPDLNSVFIYLFIFLAKMLGQHCSVQVKVYYLLLFFHSVFMSGMALQWYWTIETTVWIIVMAITLYCTPWLHRCSRVFCLFTCQEWLLTYNHWEQHRCLEVVCQTHIKHRLPFRLVDIKVYFNLTL